MNRKLLVLDIVLVAAVVYVGFQLRDEARAAKVREAAALNQQLKPPPPPQYRPQPPEPPIMNSAYLNIPDKMLWDRSRNSVVVVEPPPPPPPPPPMPPLPVYHGMMSLGSSGLTAFFSLSANTQHQPIHIGESIGQFKLLSVNSDEIALEWNGQEVRKTVAELSGLKGTPAVQVAQERTEVGPPPAVAPPPVKSGPGEMTAFGSKTCFINDGNAEGTVIEGFKKVNHTNPFGTNCTWEPVGK